MAKIGNRKAKTKIQSVTLPGYKALGSAVLKYREMVKKGESPKIKAFEDISKYFGKKGQLLKRETRYGIQRERLAKQAAEIKKEYGSRPGKKNIAAKARELTEQQKKAAATYAKRHGAKDNRFKRIAREQTAKYGKMVDVFATETDEKLKSQAYGIGSDVVERMIEDGWSPEDAEEFLKQVMETMNDIPAEARNLADQDTFWMNIKDINEVLHDNVNSDSFRDVLTAYMTTDNRDDFMDVLNNYVEMGEDIPFGEIWEGLQYYDDIASPDNMQEVIDELRGE